jgi:hypothetical protein
MCSPLLWRVTSLQYHQHYPGVCTWWYSHCIWYLPPSHLVLQRATLILYMPVWERTISPNDWQRKWYVTEQRNLDLLSLPRPQTPSAELPTTRPLEICHRDTLPRTEYLPVKARWFITDKISVRTALLTQWAWLSKSISWVLILEASLAPQLTYRYRESLLLLLLVLFPIGMVTFLCSKLFYKEFFFRSVEGSSFRMLDGSNN